MSTAALAVFVLAAIGGAYLAGFHFSENRRVAALARGHGLLAILGIVLLVLGIVRGPRSGVTIVSAVLFACVATLGLRMRSIALRPGRVPLWLVVLHAGLAVVAGVLLLVAVAGSP